MDLLAIGLAVWARILSRREGAPKWLAFLPYFIALTFIGSLGGTLLGLRHAFVSVGNVPADQKAKYLSDGIAAAMWITVYGLGLDAVFLVVLIVMTVKLKRAVTSPTLAE